METLAHIPSWLEKSDESDKTNNVSNQRFLETIFGPLDIQKQPLIVSFVGKPEKQDKRIWKGTSYATSLNTPSLYLESLESNNYFSLSVYTPDTNGFFHRRKNHFAGLYALMLDDVGTKVNLEKLALEPTALTETSTGNYQAIYVFSEAINDIKVADQIMKAVIAAGLCDPGAGGPAARLARLPNAINGKYTPVFNCKLRHWSPEKKYSLDEIIAGFNLQPYMTNAAKKAPTNKKTKVTATNNPKKIIVALKEAGLYKTPLGDGKHDITCPWVAEHTHASDNGSCYFEPSEDYPVGGYKCQHGHCSGRGLKQLLAHLGLSLNSAIEKPKIYVEPGQLDKIVDKAEKVLAKTGNYYQRGNSICIISTNLENNEIKIADLGRPTICVKLARAAEWLKYDAQKDDYIPTDPPSKYASALYDCPAYQHLPVLRGLTRQPFLLDDGSINNVPGYDANSGTYGVFSPKDYVISDNPTYDEAEEALSCIRSVLSDFCFKSSTDEAAALAAILTATIRVSLPKAPMFHTRAAQISSGKSYLNELISVFATLHASAPTAFPDNEEECIKLLLSKLLEAPAVINFDNLTDDIPPYGSLCSVLTEEYYSSRILGVSKTANVSTRVLILSSGNNVGPQQDMGRRCITIHLDPRMENPAEKEYKKPNLIDEMRANRAKYISAALTIIRAWIVAGSPKPDCRPLASFGKWQEMTCFPLMWLGLPDPTTSAYEAMREDPEKVRLTRLLNLWMTHFGKSPVTVKQLIACLDEEVKDILEDIAPGKYETVNRRSLGRWIQKQVGRVINGHRLVTDSATRNVQAWRLESLHDEV